MPIELTMPRLSDTMESGTIVKWNVKEGDDVTSGAAVADVETDKATMEMQAFDDGTIAKILVPEGKLVPVGTVIAVIAEEGEDAAEVAKGAGGGAASKGDAAPGAAQGAADGDEAGDGNGNERQSKPADKTGDGAGEKSRDTNRDTNGDTNRDKNGDRSADRDDGKPEKADRKDDGNREDGNRLRVSPVARRIADEHGIDVRTIDGSGPSGRVVKDDVLKAIESGDRRESSDRDGDDGRQLDRASTTSETGSKVRPAAKLRPGTIELSGMRQTIAKRLVESKTTIPHYQVTMRFDMAPLLDLRKTLNDQLEAQGVKLSVNDFLVRACAVAIHSNPEFNASWAGAKGITVHPNINVGIAISLPRERGGGLVVGVIKDADRKGLRQISETSKSLAEKARSRGLSAEEMSDSTFTISNLGMYGVDHFTAIINPPNSAILAVGAALEIPVVRAGQVVVGHEMSATLSLDHRVIDGAMAAEYLRTLKGLIENPAGLLV